jgi:phage/conjugal plasmid C-4 type zinc finger TraR family protein
MTDDIDRANERMQEMLADALRDQARRTGWAGKTAADSAHWCQADDCDAEIPEARRAAIPGCQLCVACQAQLENKWKRP